MIEEICQCPDEKRHLSIISTTCKHCGKSLWAKDYTYELAKYANKKSAGKVDGNAEGLVQEAYEITQTDPGRRTVLAGIFGFATKFRYDIAVGSSAGLIGTIGGTIYLENRKANVITSNHIDDLQVLLNLRGADSILEAISKYRVDGNTAVANLFLAVYYHVYGGNTRASLEGFNKLADFNYEPRVLQYIRMMRSKVSGLLGMRFEAMEDIDYALSINPGDEIGQLTLLRQGMVFGYTSVPLSSVNNPHDWTQVRRYQNRALELMNIGSDRFNDREGRFNKASSKFGSFLAAGILITDALMNAAEARFDDKECLSWLEWHNRLIDAMQDVDPVTGWNRYSPLAAQAISLGHLRFARKVLKQAEDYAYGTGRNKQVAIYATRQRETEGDEWLVHRLQMAAFWIESARVAGKQEDSSAQMFKAQKILEPILEPRNHAKIPFMLRAAKIYEGMAVGSELDSTELTGTQVETSLPPAYSHWTYFPKLEEIHRELNGGSKGRWQ